MYIYQLVKKTYTPLAVQLAAMTTGVGDHIRAHLANELGSSYKDLVAAAERDNATRASDKALFFILLVSILVTGGLVSYRLWVHTKVVWRQLSQNGVGYRGAANNVP